MNIVLMGYMGSGKSLIGRTLSEKVKMEYLDLDDYIEIQEKKTISDIFSDKGEIYFRKRETAHLIEVLKKYDNKIISLGGGTPCFLGNLEILKEDSNVQSIYLQTSLEELTKRLLPERHKRPLIAHIDTFDGLMDFIRKHVFERSFYYNQSNHIIKTDQKDANQISEESIALLF
ncbi:shikimate kinase [Aquimarina pacifica]|uniref:shikimate kinase n=1 Tax=Aquimarina pacifica TaxID=1296415 RepID=UPI000470FA87|nr:shikimate kinase [Aquimarina pacifica]